MKASFDFFKPRRETTKDLVQNLPKTFAEKVEIFTDEPVFDGQYSNQCYQDRIREAYQHYKEESGREKPYENWRFLIFHLLCIPRGSDCLLKFWLRKRNEYHKF